MIHGKITHPVFTGLEIYFMMVVRAFQKHLDIINEPEIVYHPVNEIDDDAYHNDYYWSEIDFQLTAVKRLHSIAAVAVCWARDLCVRSILRLLA